MSLNKGIIKKYSQALYNIVVKENDVNQISVRLHSIKSILKSIPELNQLLITRRVGIKDKIAILTNILGNKMSDIEMDLMVLLMENGHVRLLEEIVKRFDYLVDKDSEGVIIEELFTSIDGSNHGSINFVEVRVPEQNVVGDIGKGIPVAIDKILRERLEQAAIASGMTLRVIKLLEAHLSERNGAGKRMGDIEGIRLRYADMRIKTYAIRSVLYRTSKMLDESNDFINEITMARVFCTETASEVIDWGLQIYGSRSLIRGHPLEEMYRRIRSMRLAGGASDVLRLNVSRGVFDFQSGIL